jgi:hypothetical protein
MKEEEGSVSIEKFNHNYRSHVRIREEFVRINEFAISNDDKIDGRK